MLRIRPFATALSIAAALGVGCTINENTPSGTNGNDGTTPIAPSAAQAMVTGHVDSSMQGDVQVQVNASSRSVVLAPDNSFVVRDVPTGDVKLSCASGSFTGELTIQNVQPGEIIDVSIRIDGQALVITIKSRTKASEPPREVDTQSGDALEITASHVCYWFKPGHYKRDVIVTGSDVHLFGAAHESCVVDDLTFLDGKLEIRGDDVTVYDVELAGDLAIAGKSCHVQDTCTKCFNEGCKHACSGSGECGGKGGGEHEDAGAPFPPVEPDAGGPPPQPDAGVTHDSGTTTDAGDTVDAGVTVDASVGVDAGGGVGVTVDASHGGG